MTSDAWRVERWCLTTVAGIALIGGVVTGAWTLSLLLPLLVYMGWHLRRMIRVERWLLAGGSISRAPDVSGIWGRIVRHVVRLQQRNRRRKRQLTEILERFHRSTEAMPDAAVVLGEHYMIEWANAAAAGLLGIRNPRDHDQRVDNLLRDPAFQAYLHNGDFSDWVEMASPRDLRVDLNIRIVAYGGSQYLLIARDVTSLRRLEAARRDFVANVSHELRTPLTVIEGYVESFADEAVNDDVRSGLDAIDRQTRRMLSIVEDLLTLSRLEMESPDPGAAETVAVAERIEELVHDVAGRARERDHAIELDLDRDLGLRGVGDDLASAVGNLLANALQHTPDGAPVRITWQAEADTAVLAVTDQGQGIDPRHIARLTERFYRVDTGRSRARGGTGLGLSVAKHAVARNGGQLTIDSTPGQGSTFRCVFPAARVVQRSALDPPV